LRVPPDLAEVVDRLAEELHTSRNDALLQLAARGAALYRQEMEIAAVREQRWAAVLESYRDVDENDLPSADEAYDAIMSANRSSTACWREIPFGLRLLRFSRSHTGSSGSRREMFATRDS
jgi:predicted transcriptional regulator